MNDTNELYNMGVDIDSSFTFTDGDLKLCRYKDNLVQAIVNRLNTSFDSMDLFYEDYGSIFTQFLGWKANETTLSFIKVEIENVLGEEDRLDRFDVTVKYNGEGKVQVELGLYPTNEDTLLEVNLVSDEVGVLGEMED